MLLAALTLPSWASAETTSHSGRIVAVDKEAGTIVLHEIGPWQVEKGVTQITTQTIAVSPLTEFKRVTRVPGPGPTGWIGDFVEESLGAWQVKTGDFVTVHVQRQDDRPTALKIVVAVTREP